MFKDYSHIYRSLTSKLIAYVLKLQEKNTVVNCAKFFVFNRVCGVAASIEGGGGRGAGVWSYVGLCDVGRVSDH